MATACTTVGLVDGRQRLTNHVRQATRNPLSNICSTRARLPGMLRPGSWTRPAGGSPVRVGTGAPGSRPQPGGETRQAERGVKSLFGGSKRAGRSVKRTLQPRHNHNGRAEPLLSRRRPCLTGPVPGSACRVSPGYGRWHARTVWSGTGETRLTTPDVGHETGRISRW